MILYYHFLCKRICIYIIFLLQLYIYIVYQILNVFYAVFGVDSFIWCIVWLIWIAAFGFAFGNAIVDDGGAWASGNYKCCSENYIIRRKYYLHNFWSSSTIFLKMSFIFLLRKDYMCIRIIYEYEIFIPGPQALFFLLHLYI